MTQHQQTGGRPRETRADAAIEKAVRQLLTESGYDTLTMDGVAQRAGVSKATIYRRWRSKAELVFAVGVHNPHDRPELDTGSARGDLLAFMHAVRDTMSDPVIADAAGALITELGRNPALAAQFAHTFLAVEREDIAAIIERAWHRGEIVHRPDTATLHLAVTGPVFFALYAYRIDIDDRQLQAVVDLVLSGMRHS